MSQPLVSVLVPIYNVEKYIERCARSIFEQAYENLEIIFVNDCTPDNSVGVLRKVLAEYPNRIAQTQIINHEKNLGLAGARLTGLKASTGKYIQNIDSDDYIDKNMISEMVALAERENADITICDFMDVYTNKKEHIYVNPPLDPLRCMESVLVGIVHSSVCNKLIRRDLFINNRIHQFVGLDLREDFSVLYKLVYYCKRIAYLPKAYYYYRQNASSMVNNYNEKSGKSGLLLIDDLSHFIEKERLGEIDSRLKEMVNYKIVSILCEYLLLSQERQYLQEYIELVRAFKLRYYCLNPILPMHYKLTGIFYKIRLRNLASVIRVLYKNCK